MRTKQVFDTDEIAHLWRHQTQESARNAQGNLFFEKDTIYSYRRGFPIARHIAGKKGDKAILFTTRTYSVTTGRHIADVRRAIHGNDVKVFYVEDVDGSSSRQLESYQDRIKNAATEVIAPRIRQTTRVAKWEALLGLIEDANDYARFIGVKPTFKTPESMEALEGQLELERKRDEAKNKRIQARRNREHAAIVAQVRAESGPMIQAWIAGESRIELGGEQQYVRVPYAIPEAYLRVEDGEVVTSKCARFPIDHAKRAFRFVAALRAKGQTWQTNGHTFHVGHFKLDKVDIKGNVTAGCHFVEWAEIERFGKVLEQMAEVGASEAVEGIEDEPQIASM